MNYWILCALTSAFFSGLMAILSKISMRYISVSLAAELRAIIEVVFLLIFGLFTRSIPMWKDVSQISFHGVLFIILAGCASGLSWLFFLTALKHGPTTPVNALEFFSLIFTLVFCAFALDELVTMRMFIGIIIMIIGSIFVAG